MRLHSRQMKDWPIVRHDGEPEPMTAVAVLEIEKAFPALVDDGRKANAVRQRFGVSMTRYHQRLNILLRDPEFIASDPVTARLLGQRQIRFLRQRSA